MISMAEVPNNNGEVFLEADELPYAAASKHIYKETTKSQSTIYGPASVNYKFSGNYTYDLNSGEILSAYGAQLDSNSFNPPPASAKAPIESWDAPFIDYNETIAHATGFVKTTIGGNYVYNPNTGEIVSAYNPIVKKIEFEDFYDWEMEYKNLTTRASITNSGFNAEFTATMTIYGSYTKSGYDIHVNMGVIRPSIRGDASGVILD